MKLRPSLLIGCLALVVMAACSNNSETRRKALYIGKKTQKTYADVAEVAVPPRDEYIADADSAFKVLTGRGQEALDKLKLQERAEDEQVKPVMERYNERRDALKEAISTLKSSGEDGNWEEQMKETEHVFSEYKDALEQLLSTAGMDNYYFTSGIQYG